MDFSKSFLYKVCFIKNKKRGRKMEETLYNIEIHKDDIGYLGKLFSDVDGVKEFKNEYLDPCFCEIK